MRQYHRVMNLTYRALKHGALVLKRWPTLTAGVTSKVLWGFRFLGLPRHHVEPTCKQLPTFRGIVVSSPTESSSPRPQYCTTRYGLISQKNLHLYLTFSYSSLPDWASRLPLFSTDSESPSSADPSQHLYKKKQRNYVHFDTDVSMIEH